MYFVVPKNSVACRLTDTLQCGSDIQMSSRALWYVVFVLSRQKFALTRPNLPFTFTFSSGRPSPANAETIVGPMRNPNKPKGYLNLFVSLAKLKRVHKVIWRISSDVKIAEPISFNLRCIVAAHWPRKCIAVSSASLHKGHIGSVDIFITDKCLLSRIYCMPI